MQPWSGLEGYSGAEKSKNRRGKVKGATIWQENGKGRHSVVGEMRNEYARPSLKISDHSTKVPQSKKEENRQPRERLRRKKGKSRLGRTANK